MKTVLFVPGSGEDINSRNYDAVLGAIESEGYKTEFVSIKWKYTTIYNWEDELKKAYEKYDAADTVLAGFSWGAMTAYVTAANRVPSELWLFSLSPYFKEALHLAKPRWLQAAGKRRSTAFEQLSFDTAAEKITCKTKFFMGDHEIQKFESMKFMLLRAQEKLIDVTHHIVPGVGHEVDNPAYIAAIKHAIRQSEGHCKIAKSRRVFLLQ